MHRRPQRATIAAAVCTLASLVLAQTEPQQNPPDEIPAHDPRLVESLTIPPMELALRLPGDTTNQLVLGQPGTITFTITPDGEPWRLAVIRSDIDGPLQSRHVILNDLIDTLRDGAREVDQATNLFLKSTLEVIEEEPDLVLLNRPASRAYLHGQVADRDVLIGLTVVELTPRRILVARFDTSADRSDTDRSLYEAILNAAEIDEQGLTSDQRSAAVIAGQMFLDQVADDEYDAVLEDEPRFFRIYRVDESGQEVEIGFQRIEIRLGQLGETQPDRPRENWSAEDREYGYLVSVRSRLLAPARADAAASFFLSRDHRFETGMIMTRVEQVVRAADVIDAAPTPLARHEQLVSRETLIRRDRRLTVTTELATSPTTRSEISLPERGYLAGPELYMLPRLIAAQNQGDKPALFQFGFYQYDPAKKAVVFRADTFQRTSGTRWTSTSTKGDGPTVVTTQFDAEGRILRRSSIIPGQPEHLKRITEPITREALLELWRRKGLPTD